MKTLAGFAAGAVSALGLVWARHHGWKCPCGCRHGRPCTCGCASCRRKRLLHHENAIRTAVEQCADKVQAYFRALRDSARDVARSVRGEQLDEDLLRQVFSRHDALLAQVRDEVVDLLRRIHESLDPPQRERLARFIESWHGWHRFHHHGWRSEGCR
jgi:hypothetical protein